MTKPNAEELDLAMYMAALVIAAAEDAAERSTEEQRARLQTWYETYEAAPESVKLSMKKITEKDLKQHLNL